MIGKFTDIFLDEEQYRIQADWSGSMIRYIDEEDSYYCTYNCEPIEYINISADNKYIEIFSDIDEELLCLDIADIKSIERLIEDEEIHYIISLATGEDFYITY